MRSPAYLASRLLHKLLVFAEKRLPGEGIWFGMRFRIDCKARHGPFQQAFIQKVYPNDAPIEVLGGPFEGMRYFDGTFFGPITSRWLGCYEEALHSVVREVFAGNYRTIIDVGSAEGYYAVGLARALPQCEVYSFDTDPISRSQQKHLIELNGTKNLRLGSFCDHAFLSRPLEGPVFLLVDIEGWEWKLLDPEVCPALAKMDILTEIHDGFGLTYQQMIDGLTARFAATHEVIQIHDTPRVAADYMARTQGRLSESELDEAANEYRPWRNSWLRFRPRNA
ncbi:hypothetical protein [Haloferula sp. BvORR071]|uniref:hypothetical protein n=1 Tax=Haloferula sp. BvORR071 TaxID=1396141 RepID=UPI000557C499|nr:hypothetical protein [Haloferula sp. BvORR071]